MVTKKFAVFVEGSTEQKFVERLLSEIAGSKASMSVKAIEYRKAIAFARLINEDKPTEYFILIVNCTSDEGVKSRIREHWDALKDSGYTKVLGLRDLYPLPREDLKRVLARLKTGLPDDPTDWVHIIVAVMEVEAWFLAETQHFLCLNKNLSPGRIKDRIGYDLFTDDPTKVQQPSTLLDQIYELAGLNYK